MCNIHDQNQAYQKLENSLTDVIAEEQAKLGYRKEAIRLYYPLGSLNHFFNSNDTADSIRENAFAFTLHRKPQNMFIITKRKTNSFMIL